MFHLYSRFVTCENKSVTLIGFLILRCFYWLYWLLLYLWNKSMYLCFVAIVKNKFRYLSHETMKRNWFHLEKYSFLVFNELSTETIERKLFVLIAVLWISLRLFMLKRYFMAKLRFYIVFNGDNSDELVHVHQDLYLKHLRRII